MLLEYNARFGDPETQVMLPRLRGGIAEAVRACTEERLPEVEFDWDPRPAVGVVMASGGYPNQYGIGHRIEVWMLRGAETPSCSWPVPKKHRMGMWLRTEGVS